MIHMITHKIIAGIFVFKMMLFFSPGLHELKQQDYHYSSLTSRGRQG